MKYYKLHQNDHQIHEVKDENDFMKLTNGQSPWIKYDKVKHQNHYYALCPKCQNPVVLCNLVRHTNNKVVPYARHVKKYIYGLADFSDEKFESCPFIKIDIDDISTNKYLQITDEIRVQIDLLRRNFDKVIYILERETGIYFSQAQQREMLKYYVNDEIYLYKYIDSNNLPWLFNHCFSFSLFGVHIREDSELAKALSHDSNIYTSVAKFFEHEHKGYISQVANPKKFVDLKFVFGEYKIKEEGDDEVIVCSASYKTSSNKYTTVFTKEIKVAPLRWQRLLNYDDWHRDEIRLKLADEILGKFE